MAEPLTGIDNNGQRSLKLTVK